jgi:hypothetical protein
VKHPEELNIFEQLGVSVIRLEDIVREMITMQAIISSAAGNDLVALIHLGQRGVSPRTRPAGLLEAVQDEVEEESTESSDDA